MVNAFNQLYITSKTERFSFKSGRAMQVAKLIKEDWPIVLLEVQRYMIWVYRYIAAFVSRYSDILYDTVKCELADFYR